MENKYADIVLRLAAPGTFQFSVPEHLQSRIRPGQRVRVPLRHRRDIGYVAGLSSEPKVKGIRPIESLLDSEPLLPDDLLKTLLWTAEHYLAPPGLVFRSALPRAIHLAETSRATAREKTVSFYRLADSGATVARLLEGLQRKAPRQAEIIARLADGPLPAAELPGRASLKSLVAKGVLQVEERSVRRGVVPAPSQTPSLPTLNSGQEEVFQRIRPGLAQKRHESFLLHGVTGSGKTEIYARAILALPPHRQAVILVPEVSLTSHLIRHIGERIAMPMAVWHHQLSEGEKYDLWKALKKGEIRVVIGARSAIFAPLPDIGLIVLDEEQESSYKQEEMPPYHARDVAARRVLLAGSTLILGSATPSIESFHAAENGEHDLLSLPERHGGRPLPQVEMIDLKSDVPGSPTGKAEKKKAASPSALSPLLREAAREVLERGEQVFFFLNRRGFAPFTHCTDCGWAFKCPNCLVSLVFHSQDRSLLCHYCGYRDTPPESCPSCGGLNLRLSGTGTQRLEAEIRGLFPRHRVTRLDRDAAAKKGEGGRLVRDFAEGKAEILVGTQMAAKGFHFPRLSLVGVLAPDIGLNMPDFRAAERTFQIVTQAAGRTGRGTSPGRVLIQTFQPEHYALQAAAKHDFLSFYRQETAFRRELEYPPYCELILLRIDGPNPHRLERAADELADNLRRELSRTDGCRILGPVPAPLARIRNRFRLHILIKAQPLEAAAAILGRKLGTLEAIVKRVNGRLAVDVNPSHLM